MIKKSRALRTGRWGMTHDEAEQEIAELEAGFRDVLDGWRSLVGRMLVEMATLEARLDERRAMPSVPDQPTGPAPMATLKERPWKLPRKQACRKCGAEFIGPPTTKLCDECKADVYAAGAERLAKSRRKPPGENEGGGA